MKHTKVFIDNYMVIDMLKSNDEAIVNLAKGIITDTALYDIQRSLSKWDLPCMTDCEFLNVLMSVVDASVRKYMEDK